MKCNAAFSFFNRRHHCRSCGKLLCSNCLQKKFKIPSISPSPVKVCDECYQNLISEQEKIKSLHPEINLEEESIIDLNTGNEIDFILTTDGTFPSDNDSSESTL